MTDEAGRNQQDGLDPRASDPDWVVFLSDPAASAAPGTEIPHGRARDFILRRKTDVANDWDKTVATLHDIVAKVPMPAGNFHLEEIEVGLAVTAEGQLAFVAKAGVEATVTMTFRRKE